MIRLLQWLFVGHFHKWKTIDEYPIVNEMGKRIGTAFYQQCEGCGTVKCRELP